MSTRRHEQQTRTSDSGHGVLGVWLPFCGVGGFETHGGGILVVVEGDAAVPGVSGPQRGASPDWLSMLVLKLAQHIAEGGVLGGEQQTVIEVTYSRLL